MKETWKDYDASTIFFFVCVFPFLFLLPETLSEFRLK